MIAKDSAIEIAEIANQSLANAARHIKWLYENEIPESIGVSLEEFAKLRLSGFQKYKISLPQLERKEAVIALYDLGLSQRQIAPLVGVDHSTVSRDLATGADAPKIGADAPKNTWANRISKIKRITLQDFDDRIETRLRKT